MNHENHLLPVPGPAPLPEPLTLMPPPEGPHEPLRKVLSALRGRWPWAVGLALVLSVAGGAAGFFVGGKTLKYTSTGLIRVKANPESVIYRIDENKAPVGQMFDVRINTEIDYVRSPRILEEASRQPDLRGIETSAGDLIGFIRNNLTVERGNKNEIIQVSFTNPDPGVAQKVAKAVMDSYMRIQGEREIKDLEAKRRKLEGIHDTQTQELERHRKRRAEVTAQFAAPELDYLHRMKLTEEQKRADDLQKLRLALKNAKVDPDELLKNRPAAGTTAQGDKPAANAPQPLNFDEANLEVLGDSYPDLKKLLNERDALNRELEQLSARYGSESRQVEKLVMPKVRFNEREIRRFLDDVREGNRGGALGPEGARSVEQLKTDFLEITDAYNRVHGEVQALNNAMTEMNKIQADEAATQKKLQDADDSLNKLKVEQTTVQQIDRASEPELPTDPSSDKRVLLTAAGGMFGGGLGFVLVLLIGLMDPRLRSIGDAEESFARTPMLGILPTLPDNLADPEQAALAAHCVHQVRTLLQIGPDSQGRRVFTVTSPSPQAGKTSLTLSLGLSYAASGAKTLLIDCDLGFGGLTHRMNAVIRRKIGQVLLRERLVTSDQLEQALHLARQSNRRVGETLVDLGYLSAETLREALTLQEKSPVGLMDAVEGEPLENCVTESGTDNLFILPNGGAEPGHVARLSPSALRRLLDQARAQFDVILVDTGSVLGSLEASHVGAESDGVVLVVSRGEQRELAEHALDHLRSIGARVAGIVFNRAEGRDVEIVASRSSISMMSRPVSENGHRKGDGDRPRMGPMAGAVVSSSSTRARRTDKQLP